MRRSTMNRSEADQHIEKHGGRIFLHLTGRLGYQPHLLSADNEIIARVIEDETEAETTETAASNEETKMNDYRVYTRTNNGRIIAETTVQADNLESAQRKAFRQAKKDGLIPNEKHNASYGTMGWVANGENQYRRSVVYGDRFKSRAYELHLEMIIETETEAITETESMIETNDLDAMKKEQERVAQEWLLYFNSSDMECLMHANRLYTKSNVLASDIKYLEELNNSS